MNYITSSSNSICLAASNVHLKLIKIACGKSGTEETCFYEAPTGIATHGTCRL